MTTDFLNILNLLKNKQNLKVWLSYFSLLGENNTLKAKGIIVEYSGVCYCDYKLVLYKIFVQYFTSGVLCLNTKYQNLLVTRFFIFIFTVPMLLSINIVSITKSEFYRSK